MSNDCRCGECKEFAECMARRETALPPVRSEPMLATTFADFWHAKWPHQTRDVKRLEMSVHYTGCREAYYAGAAVAAYLNRIYFEIAAECIGENEVRKRRDARIANKQKATT